MSKRIGVLACAAVLIATGCATRPGDPSAVAVADATPPPSSASSASSRLASMTGVFTQRSADVQTPPAPVVAAQLPTNVPAKPAGPVVPKTPVAAGMKRRSRLDVELRFRPRPGARIRQKIPAGQRFTVVAGDVRDGIYWWYLSSGNLGGWVADATLGRGVGRR